MLTGAQDFRLKMIELVKTAFGSSYTQYRFNKKSNFYTFEEFQTNEAIDSIIQLGKELERMKDLKAKTNDELKSMVDLWHNKDNHALVDSITRDQSNAHYAKQCGIDASYELKRREDEAYFNAKVS